MKNRFGIIHQDFFIKKESTINEGNEFSLLFQNDDVEIVRYHYPAGTQGAFKAVRAAGGIEFYYIISGRATFIFESGERRCAEQGDLFYVAENNPYVIFDVTEELTWIAFLNYHSYDDDEKRTEYIISIMKSLQEKDGDTFEHCDRVKKLVSHMGQRMSYPIEKIATLMNAAMFHDVGKSKIPIEILLKPDKLNDEEFRIIRKHSEYSDEIVRPLCGDEIGDIVRYHHERIDGMGYPDGINGEEIPIEAKMIAVADSYDAMVTVRPYNPGKSKAEAIAELKRCSGTQFDPDCVAALCSYLEETK